MTGTVEILDDRSGSTKNAATGMGSYLRSVPVVACLILATVPASSLATEPTMVEGFSQIVRASNQGQAYPGYRGALPSYWAYAKRTTQEEVVWRTAIISQDGPVELAFTAATGEGGGLAEIRLDGRAALQFETGITTGNLQWTGDGLRLRFVHRSFSGGVSGYYLLLVPEGMLGAGHQAEISVTLLTGGPRSWFMIREITDTIRYEDLLAGPPIGAKRWYEEATAFLTLQKDSLLGSLRRITGFDTLVSSWSTTLRNGVTIFLFAFYFLSTLAILLDGTKTPLDSPPQPALPPSRLRQGTSALFTLAMCALVLAFPWAYEWGFHGWIIPAALILALLGFRETSHRRLALYPPVRPHGWNLFGLAVLAAGACLLGLWRWQSVPASMHGDEATIGIAGRDMWNLGWHPFFFNNAGGPALLNVIDGLFIKTTGDPWFGLRVYPLMCGVLSIVVFHRWIALIAQPPLPWFAATALIATPFYQFYSRTGTGMTLVFAQLVFLYGFTRCLVSKGAKGPVLAGVALGVAHWDYWAARSLVLFLCLAPLGVLAYGKQLEKRWWARLFAAGALAIPLILPYPLMREYQDWHFTWMMTPRQQFDLPEPLSRGGLEPLQQKLKAHFQMWFDSSQNEAGPMTVPGSPVLPFPLGAMALVGLALTGLSFSRASAFVVLGMFAMGMLGSFLSKTSPNGHRIILAEVPVAVFIGLALSALWPPKGLLSTGFVARSRMAITLALLGAGVVAGLHYFHVEIPKDRRAIAAQEFGDHHRAIRAKRDLETCNVRLCPPYSSADRLLLDQWNPEYLDFGSWLPPNWETRPTCVHGSHRVQGLLPLFETAFPRDVWEDVFDPAGRPAGWSYRTRGLRLGERTAQTQWSTRGVVTGSLMLPEEGTLEIACPGYRFNYHNPVAPGSIEGHGVLTVVRGLTEVTIEPLNPGTHAPPPFRMEYRPADRPPAVFQLAPADLYSTPVHGWVRQVREIPLPGSAEPQRVQTAIVPTVWTWGTTEQAPMRAGFERRTAFSALPSLPPGIHHFRIDTANSSALRVTSGDREILSFEATKGRTANEFVLDSSQANGNHLQILTVDIDDSQDVSLVISQPSGERSVPPYPWFAPAAPWPF
jgi:hypothetical protein